MVVPKQQIDQVWDLSDDEYTNLWNTSKKIALHLRTVMKVERVGVVVKGFDVPHAHIHLIPIPPNTIVNLDPYPEPPIADNDTLAEIAQQIRL